MLNGVEKQLIFHLKLFFLFKGNLKEREVKEYLIRADYASRDCLSLTDWIRNLGVGAVPIMAIGERSQTQNSSMKC
jgi:hypothetical protein